MTADPPARVARELARRGYNAEREAVTLLAEAADPERAVDHTLEAVPDGTVTVTHEHVRAVLDAADRRTSDDGTCPVCGGAGTIPAVPKPLACPACGGDDGRPATEDADPCDECGQALDTVRSRFTPAGRIPLCRPCYRRWLAA